MLIGGVYSGTATDSSPFNTKNAIIGRDSWDCTKSDLIFMNLLSAKKVSIGTMTELGWGDAARIPIIVVMEASGNPHDSIYLRELSTYLVHDLDSGIAIARCFFNAPVPAPDLVFGGFDEATGKGKLVLFVPKSF